MAACSCQVVQSKKINTHADIFICNDVVGARKKLERSIAAIVDLEEGHIINENDLHLLSPGDGFKWTEKDSIIGKKLKMKVSKDEIIYSQYLL